MFRNRTENLRSIYALLFLNVAFFLLQHQDPTKFVRLFAFDWHSFASGDLWRAFTYQFMQAGHVGLITIPPVVTLFLNLILLTLMGMSVEEEWGTFHFLNFYLISTLTTAAVAAYLGTPLLGSFFINFTLLFVYATLNREQTFYLLIIPIRVTFLAWLALAEPGTSGTDERLGLSAGDGISQIWNVRYGAEGIDPNADSDGDGLINRLEAVAGTDPFDAKPDARRCHQESAQHRFTVGHRSPHRSCGE